MNNYKFNMLCKEIGIALGADEILCQLAEEAAELSQAALKLRRARTKTNPTVMSVEGATGNLYEEIADVILCFNVLASTEVGSFDPTPIETHKIQRWKKRLEENGNG